MPRTQPTMIWMIDDSEDHAKMMAADLVEAIPKIEVATFQSVMEAHSHRNDAGRPAAIVVDLSAVGSLMQPEHMYGPIAMIHQVFPKAVVVISSAVSARFAESVADDVREHCPDAQVEIVDWGDCRPYASLREIIEKTLS